MNTLTNNTKQEISEADRIKYYTQVILLLSKKHKLKINPSDFKDVDECRAIIDDLILW